MIVIRRILVVVDTQRQSQTEQGKELLFVGRPQPGLAHRICVQFSVYVLE